MERKIYKVFKGPAGQVVTVFDQTINYAYSNIFQVKLVVEAEFPDSQEKYTRTLDKLGVFIEHLDETKQNLVDSFENHGLCYLFAEGFAKNLEKRNEELRKKGVL